MGGGGGGGLINNALAATSRVENIVEWSLANTGRALKKIKVGSHERQGLGFMTEGQRLAGRFNRKRCYRVLGEDSQLCCGPPTPLYTILCTERARLGGQAQR